MAKHIRLLEGGELSSIFKEAESRGLFTDFSEGTVLYEAAANKVAKKLVHRVKTKPDILLVKSARLVGMAYDRAGSNVQHNERVVNYAITIIKHMAKLVKGGEK